MRGPMLDRVCHSFQEAFQDASRDAGTCGKTAR
jgi:hypothetical protein